jgi:hypothetical protein
MYGVVALLIVYIKAKSAVTVICHTIQASHHEGIECLHHVERCKTIHHDGINVAQSVIVTQSVALPLTVTACESLAVQQNSSSLKLSHCNQY